MSILAVTRRGVAARSAFSLSTAIRCQSSNAPSQSSVEVAEKETKEITTPAPQKEAVAADVISGAPSMSNQVHHRVHFLTSILAELRHRTVRVYRPAKSTMQSGGMKSDKWRIDFDILPGGARWENPLMGWASSYVLIFPNPCVR